MTEHPSVFPSVRYADAHRAIDFLADAFGAERHAVHTDGENRVRHAELRFGNGMVMLGEGDTASGGGVYVVIDDVDAHCERARAAGAEITRGPQDTEYGSREYSALDREGLDWHFGTYQPFAV